MSFLSRLAFLGWALVLCPVLVVAFLDVLLKIRDDEYGWFLVTGLPAALTVGAGLLARRRAAEIVVAAALSAAISALVVFLVILAALAS